MQRIAQNCQYLKSKMVILYWMPGVWRTVRSQSRAWVEGRTDVSNVNIYILIWNLSLLWKEILITEI